MHEGEVEKIDSGEGEARGKSEPAMARDLSI